MIRFKAISLWQPWASAIALGLKTIETRSWLTDYTGPLAIHAAQKRNGDNAFIFDSLRKQDARIGDAFAVVDYAELPFGKIVCVANLVGCTSVFEAQRNGITRTERLLGDYEPGRFAWQLDDVVKLTEPHPVSGRQGFFFCNIPERCLPEALRAKLAKEEKATDH